MLASSVKGGKRLSIGSLPQSLIGIEPLGVNVFKMINEWKKLNKNLKLFNL
jgi:hypothetical protein